jgi:hypothetical protein
MSIEGMVHSDPHSTEVAAALALLPHLKRIRRQVYEAFIAHGPMTDEELASLPEFCRMVYSTARQRRVELYQARFLRIVGQRKNKRGNFMMVWAVSPSTADPSKLPGKALAPPTDALLARVEAGELSVQEYGSIKYRQGYDAGLREGRRQRIAWKGL